MKNMLLAEIILSIILLTVSAGCGASVLPATTTPIPSNTAIPISTPKPTLTSSPTETPTQTPTPVVERDLQPAYIETVEQAYNDVEIKLSIVTDASLDSSNPPLHKIYINPHFNSYDGENSKDALAHLVALTFYKLWRSRQIPLQPTSDADFKSYLQLWSQAQKSNDLADWEKVQITSCGPTVHRLHR